MITHAVVPRRLVLSGLLVSLSTICPAWAVDSISLTPFSCCDGRFQTTAVANRVQVWQSIYGDSYFYFDIPSSFTFKPGVPVYLEVTYYNQGSGSVGVEYDSTKGNSLADAYREADKRTGGSRTGDGTFVSAYYELSFPRFAGRQNGGADFRLHLVDGGSVPLSVKSVVIQNSPFVIVRQDSVKVTPFSCCDGQFQTATAGGQAVWRDLPGNSYMYFQIPYTWNFKPGAPAYLQITYYDEGYGTVWVQYDSAFGNSGADLYRRSDTHTRSSRVNSRTFVDSYHELLLPKFAGRQNGGADFRLSLSAGGNVPLSVKAVTITNKPFSNAGFQYALTKPWLRAYTGSTKDYVDRSTLNHKVMVGYQGWFRTPNDLADGGWGHWCRDGVMTPANFTVDMWPDLTEFKPAELSRAAEVMTRSGKPAYLFSSTTRETVRRHFQWMRKYNIDGAFVGRFVHSSSSGAWGHDEWTLHLVREAANLEGRIWAIGYDVSSLSSEPNPLATIVTDWKWLVDVLKVRDDRQYAYEGGKPVVFIWGLPFPDRKIPKATADAIVDFFQHDVNYGGNYVLGGLPWWWWEQTDWYDHVRQYDGALTWMPPNQQAYLDDYQRLRSWGVDYFPHVWPGFSWANLQHQTGDKDYTPRQGGAFLWQKMCEALGSGASRLFIGMFDEYDEGTAIMPMSDDPPSPPAAWGRFVTNEGAPSDWWMVLAGEGRGRLLRHRPYRYSMPAQQELANRSNIGSEAWIDLGTVDAPSQLRRNIAAGGDTWAEVLGGRDCRRNATPESDHYFYFDVDSSFAYAVSQGLDVTIEVEYLDSAGFVELSLEYDSTSNPYTRHPLVIETQASGEWRTVRFEIADAYLGNRQYADTDFRLCVTESSTLYINRVWVRKE